MSKNDILKNLVLNFFYNNTSKAFNYKQVSKGINVADNSVKKSVQGILQTLKRDGILHEQSIGKFKLKTQKQTAIGIIDKTKTGAYVIVEGLSNDIYISPENINNALNGDKVKVLYFDKSSGKKLRGEVIEIIERKNTEFVGVLTKKDNSYIVIPVNYKVSINIIVHKNNLLDAQINDKVIVKIISWDNNEKNPEGEIIKVLGPSGDNEVEMHAILSEFNLPIGFPEKIDEVAEKINLVINEKALKDRKDFRDTYTFTIDPDDAKDFDDALSFKILEDNIYEIGVHIADVSYYVRPNDLIDNEASNRATSVYLVDRVIPMLPEKLSNNICSLKPNEDRLCFATIFKVDSSYNIIDFWIGRTIINSDKRYTYDEAQIVIDGNVNNTNEPLTIINNIAKKFRADRIKNGAIEFERDEVKIKVNSIGYPVLISKKSMKESNKLIEEWMLLANRTVAKFLSESNKKTGVYRVHDLPNIDKLVEFNRILKVFGYKIQLETPNLIAKSLNQLFIEIQDTPYENILNLIAVKSMAKAIYSTENKGHYGLGFRYYTHFTSPIRRYPDLLVHRLLELYLSKQFNPDGEMLDEMCKHSSDMEKRATNAERASIKYKQVEFLSTKVGEIYEGIVTDLTNWGIYVELTENFCEGMIKLNTLKNDYYYFNDLEYCIVGHNFGEKIKLGDKLFVKIESADLLKRQLNFKYIKKNIR